MNGILTWYATEDFDEADFGESHAVGDDPDGFADNATMTSGRFSASGHPNGFKPGPPHVGAGSIDTPQSRNAGTNNQSMQQPPQRNNIPPQQQPHTPGPPSRHPPGMPSRPNMGPPQNAPIPPQRLQYQGPPPTRDIPTANPVGSKTNPLQQGVPAQRQDPQQPPPVVGFYPAKVATIIQESESAPPPDAPTFNPHAESPSIRKTSGVDHSKSRPINRESLGISTDPPLRPPPPHRGAFINPQLDATRKIGMPTSPSPLQNRTSYKPPGPAIGGGGAKRVLDHSIAQQYDSILLLYMHSDRSYFADTSIQTTTTTISYTYTAKRYVNEYH